MSHVTLDGAEKVEEPEYGVGDLFRVRDDICILLRLEGDDKYYYMIPVLGEHDAFNDSYRWQKELLEYHIASGFAVRLPKGSSITITQE